MRTISLFMNVTLNGYFEGPNHDVSFFKGDDADDSFFKEQSAGGATLLFGHRTYEMMKQFWPTQEAKDQKPDMARYMNEMPKIVAARQAFEPGWKNVTVVSGDVPGAVSKLKAGDGERIVILGSNTLCVSLMPQRLIDEFLIMVNPMALPDGTPLFKGLEQRIDLRLLQSRKFESGNVLLTYGPAS